MHDGAHDKLFKWAFSQIEHAAALLRGVLPAEPEAIDWSTLQVESGSYVRPGVASRYSDLLLSARLRGQTALFYFLVEHQSRADDDMPRRVLTYVTRIWERYRRKHPRGSIPLVVPIVLSHDPHGWTAHRSLHQQLRPDPARLGLVAAHVPAFELLVFDLANVPDAELRARVVGAIPRLTLAFLRDAFNDARLLDDLVRWADAVRDLIATPSGVRAMLVLLEYLASVSDMPAEEIHAKMRQAVPEAEPIIMTLAERLRAEGRQEGRQEGQAALLLQMLRLKFGEGAVADAHERSIASASAEQLQRIGARILEAETLNAVFED